MIKAELHWLLLSMSSSTIRQPVQCGKSASLNFLMSEEARFTSPEPPGKLTVRHNGAMAGMRVSYSVLIIRPKRSSSKPAEGFCGYRRLAVQYRLYSYFRPNLLMSSIWLASMFTRGSPTVSKCAPMVIFCLRVIIEQSPFSKVILTNRASALV